MKWNEARHGPQKPAARDGRLTALDSESDGNQSNKLEAEPGLRSSYIGQDRFSLKIMRKLISHNTSLIFINDTKYFELPIKPKQIYLNIL